MTRVTEETVEHIARLARLSLTAEERQTFARQLTEVLEHAQSLQALDTAGAPAPSRTTPTLREDVVRPGLDAQAAMSGAPDAADGLFRVPRVMG
jgi:aspartyl-tRNA(Asn)/glutamyl-tRNA(Gln) amidotransferase subunit C